jgi:hypothetical protein
MLNKLIIEQLPKDLQTEVEEWITSKGVSFLDLLIIALEYYFDGH